MRKRFWIALILVTLCVVLMFFLIYPQTLPDLDDAMAKSQIPQSKMQFSAQDFMDKVTVFLAYPKTTIPSDKAGADMELYSNGDVSGAEPVDTLAITYLPDGIQYEYFDSAANILYNAKLTLDATPDAVTAADFAAAKITAIDMNKLRELTD